MKKKAVTKQPVRDDNDDIDDTDASDKESLDLGNDSDNNEAKEISLSRVQDQLKNFSEDDDDDAAPDDVAFSKSKDSALETLKRARDQILKEKSDLKLKKRQRDLVNQQQKNLKKEKLERVSQEIMDSDGVESEDASEEEKSGEGTAHNQHKQFTDGEDSDSESDRDDENFMSLTPVGGKVGGGGVRAVCLGDMARMVPQMDSALAFKQQQMFGSRIKRETTSQRLSAAEKKRARRCKPKAMR